MTKIKHKVKVTTFKESGKYYDEFTIEVEAPNKWFYVMEAVKAYKPNHQVQTDMDWLIGMNEEGSTPEVANSIYPTIIKG